MPEGFLVIDKPSGPTSHDVVDHVRRVTGVRRVGHAGTLDPMATGVVVVGVGRATRLIRFLQDAEKEYLATAVFGVATDTLDAHGAIVERASLPVTRERLEEIVPRFTGTILQVPPMVSALKVDGRRLYQLAREGKEVDRNPRPVTIHRLEILEVGDGDQPRVGFRVVCGKGTYVRTLADDMARALGGRAHLIELRRIRSGTLSVGANAVALDELEDRWRSALLSPAEALRDLPAILVDAPTAERVGHGRPIEPNPSPGGSEFVRLIDESGRLLAIYRSEGSRAVPEVVMA